MLVVPRKSREMARPKRRGALSRAILTGLGVPFCLLLVTGVVRATGLPSVTSGPRGTAAVVAIQAGCPLMGMVAVTVFVVRFTTDTEQSVVPVPAAPVPQGRLGFPAFATYARV